MPATTWSQHSSKNCGFVVVPGILWFCQEFCHEKAKCCEEHLTLEFCHEFCEEHLTFESCPEFCEQHIPFNFATPLLRLTCLRSCLSPDFRPHWALAWVLATPTTPVFLPPLLRERGPLLPACKSPLAPVLATPTTLDFLPTLLSERDPFLPTCKFFLLLNELLRERGPLLPKCKSPLARVVGTPTTPVLLPPLLSERDPLLCACNFFPPFRHWPEF